MIKVDHAQATELFSSYWDEELAPERAAELEEHLAACVVCRREYKEFERAVEAVASLPRLIAPVGFVPGVVKRVQKRSRGRLLMRPLDRLPYELFSLVMLGLILAIYLILQMAQPGRVNLP
jgi:anti-sigma factor RsiW